MPPACLLFTSFIQRHVRLEAPSWLGIGWLTNYAANRTLEDLDAYYRSNPPLIVTKDPDSICSERPQKFIDHEREMVEKNAKERGQVLAEHLE